MPIVGRVTSRIFMGPDLCCDTEWIRASSEYISAAVRATGPLGSYPRWLRAYIHWFMPRMWEVRRRLNECRRILKRHIELRNTIKAEAAAQGQPCPFNDSIEWFEREYTDNYDPATSQITLAILSIHMTTDLLVETMVNVAKHPDLCGVLRDEVTRVIGTHGLSKTGLNNLKTMDSVLKESQRLKPVVLGNVTQINPVRYLD